MHGATIDTVSIDFFFLKENVPIFFVTYLACLCERCMAEKGNISYVACLRERCVAAAHSNSNRAAMAGLPERCVSRFLQVTRKNIVYSWVCGQRDNPLCIPPFVIAQLGAKALKPLLVLVRPPIICFPAILCWQHASMHS
jgi:hypothetical protein